MVSTITGIALWLVPAGAGAARLKELMITPDQVKINYEIPSFEPHITLASFPTTIASVTTLCRVTEETVSSWNKIIPKNARKDKLGLPISFQALSTGDHYFRSVLLDIVLTSELEALHSALQTATQKLLGQAACEIVARGPRFPHLSLFYVPDEHKDDRTQIRDALWDAFGEIMDTENGERRVGFRLSNKAEKVETHLTESHGDILAGFSASEIWIAKCEGAVKDWLVLERIPISQSTS